MKTIICCNDARLILVDDEDFERLNKLRWRLAHKGTIETWVTIKNKQYHVNMAQAIFRKRVLFDHKDRNCFNNQKNNLREADWSQSAANRVPKLKRNICMFRGTYPIHKKFASKITKNGKQIYLGCFKLEIDAAIAYDLAAEKLFGEFALTNKKLGLL